MKKKKLSFDRKIFAKLFNRKKLMSKTANRLKKKKLKKSLKPNK